MARGGARNRSGPAPSESSERSERRGYSLTALPAEGYDGPVPEWPLAPYVVRRWESEEGARFQVVDHEATESFRVRELALWGWAWRTPQACAWSLPSEMWRAQTVARWCRQAAKCESSDSSASDHGQLHRYADQVGLTTAGLREMGWKVAVDQVAEKAAESVAPKLSSRDRMKVVQGGRG